MTKKDKIELQKREEFIAWLKRMCENSSKNIDIFGELPGESNKEISLRSRGEWYAYNEVLNYLGEHRGN